MLPGLRFGPAPTQCRSGHRSEPCQRRGQLCREPGNHKLRAGGSAEFWGIGNGDSQEGTFEHRPVVLPPVPKSVQNQDSGEWLKQCPAFGAASSLPPQAFIHFCVYTSQDGSRFKPNYPCWFLIFLIGIFLYQLTMSKGDLCARHTSLPCAEGLIKPSAGSFGVWGCFSSPNLLHLFRFHLLFLL